MRKSNKLMSYNTLIVDLTVSAAQENKLIRILNHKHNLQTTPFTSPKQPATSTVPPSPQPATVEFTTDEIDQPTINSFTGGLGDIW